ncbi:C40 family peptidase [Rhodococcus sp. HNM0569]|uniref:NlpC/P60 family protein n=1 Tax=Rhodococcus sp. HNM0569 TaxID=2716340 RepID=UPI00146EEC15|nr:C40 family peptidase [Rhodococcus sp. HNM0569]
MASTHTKRSVRRVLAVGALAAGAFTATAVPASADPITIPGVGTFELPGVAVPPEIQNMLTPQGGQGAPSSAGETALRAAESKLGAPYVYGASGPDSFDCSGLVQWAYKQAGLNLPRTSYDQAGAGAPVSTSDLKLGDVVTFYGGSHSGIYAGDGNIIHASTSGQPVKLAPIASMPMDGARRF